VPHNLTETPTFDANVSAPDDGDDLGATTGSGPIDTPLGSLANRSQMLLASETQGAFQGPPAISSTNGTGITVGAFNSLVISAIRMIFTGATVTVSSLEGGGSFAVDTWYYLYAVWAGVVIAGQNIATIRISATAPEGTQTWKLGATDHRYLGCFLTDGSGNIIPFRKEHGLFLFRNGPGNGSVNMAAGTISLSGFLPPHVSIALINIYAPTDGSFHFDGYFRTSFADSGEAAHVTVYPSPGPSSNVTDLTFWIEVDSSRDIYMGALSAAPGNNLSLTVRGFRE
jgi:hypothetical protein